MSGILKMRRWHKLLAPWFALILFVIAFTGAVTQATAILDAPPAKSVASVGGKAGRAGMPKEEKRTALGAWNHWFKKLHSGESLGPVGIALNLAGGLALLFFAGSGVWMYLTMWLKRRRGRRLRAA
ncbi:PepSY domain-containing protein [Sphingomonas mali]|uniref:PepSY domain-containing protein n=1 Tax=Sphingomonas mali TaxID=40682 RepID=UPI001FDEFF6A|nr:PepSY domain-containing protein [Sphingomonas mali]